MRITQIREKTVAIASPISNAYIDFSKMTCSMATAENLFSVQDARNLIRYGGMRPDREGFPDGVEVQGGYITMPELPGIGFEGKSDLYREMQAR
jgi:L-alanine-DL-glutamate epimerase-like enolase superfamily enzyme